jgi:Spy/CpxP family protein refolding chaperone
MTSLKIKTMKTLLTAIIAIAALSFSATAQEQKPMGKPNGAHHQGMKQRGMLMQQLNLTEAQKTQMKAINMDFKTKMEELKKQDNITVKEFNARKEALQAERKNKTMALLTDEQKGKMEALKKEKQDKMKMMQAKHIERMQSNLNLSNDQVTKLKAKNDELDQKMNALKSNTSLPLDQKRAQMQQIRQERKAFMESILTDDQKKKMEEMKSKRMANKPS